MAMENHHYINVLLSTFPGISLSRTLNFVLPRSTTVEDVIQHIRNHLPTVDCPLYITTPLNRAVIDGNAPIASFLPNIRDDFVQLRLSAGLRGGKGGFGSQLRAAGGRMSSKRKKAQGENNGSNRNLEGRRLRTVNEAKALAEYLALKPEMDRKEKEEKRKRWQQVIDITEQREEELRNGTRGKLDGSWIEEKDEAGEKTRMAVGTAMGSGLHQKAAGHSSEKISTRERNGRDRCSDDSPESTGPGFKISAVDSAHVAVRHFGGFDNDDDFLSESDDVNCGDGSVDIGAETINL